MHATHLTVLGQLVLALSAVYHVFMGVLCMSSVKWARKIGGGLYSLKIPEQLDPRYEYTWKPLGIYAVFTAAICTLALRQPGQPFSVAVLDLLAAMYVLRAAMRWIYKDLFERGFQIAFRRSAWNIGFNCLLAGVMLLYGSA